jgi:outer membrane protein TolC
MNVHQEPTTVRWTTKQNPMALPGRPRTLPALVTLIIGALPVMPAIPETLEEAWETALTYDLRLRAGENRIDAASAELASARAERMPTLTAASTLTRWDDVPAFDFSGVGVPAQLPLFSGQSMSVSEARITQPIYVGGTVRSGIDAARASLNARERETDVLAQDIKLEVAEAYVAVLRAGSALDVADASAASLAAHAEDVEDMYRNGQVPRNDYLAAAVSFADAQQSRLQARNRLDLTRSAYNRRLGRALAAPAELEPTFPALDPAVSSGPLDRLIELAIANRNEIDALQAAAQTLQARAESMRGATRPQLFLTGGYAFLENDFLNREDFWSVGLSLRWNFFDSGRTRNAAGAISHQARALAQERSDLETLIALEVRQAWLAVNETRERLRVTESAVNQADENVRVARDRYVNGEGTNTEVLAAHTLYTRSRANRDNALYDAALAEIHLARSIAAL